MNTEEEKSWSSLSWSQKLSYVLGLMTIEPMMLVQGLAAGISMIATDQMVLYKICRGISLGIHRSMQLCTFHFCRRTV